MKLEGEKIYLKPIVLESAEVFFKWVNDPIVNKYLLLKPPENLEGEIEWLKEVIRNSKDAVFSIYIKENDKMIGNIGTHNLDNSDKNFTLGILIGEKEEWGKGYGTDAFNTLIPYLFKEKGAKRLNLTVAKKNISAQKVYLKAGFEFKATKKLENRRDGIKEEQFYMELLSKNV